MKRHVITAALMLASLPLAACVDHSATLYQQPGSAAIRDLQLRLRDAGYYPGPADGLSGAATHDALARFQAQRGLPVTGEPDRQTVLALGLDPARYAAAAYPPNPPPATAYARRRCRIPTSRRTTYSGGCASLAIIRVPSTASWGTARASRSPSSSTIIACG